MLLKMGSLQQAFWKRARETGGWMSGCGGFPGHFSSDQGVGGHARMCAADVKRAAHGGPFFFLALIFRRKYALYAKRLVHKLPLVLSIGLFRPTAFGFLFVQ
jgi:hypothetical protein